VNVEIIDTDELAKRWRLPPSWIRDQVRSRSTDPIPCYRFGRYVRFGWGSPELDQWLKSRMNNRPQDRRSPQVVHLEKPK
jgi:hypothetical protein